MSWFLKIIIADRTQYLSNKYSLPIEEIQNLLQYDPTNDKYLEWITKNYKSKELRFPEDGSKTRETLTTFTKLHPVLRRNNVPIDINLYSYSDLVRLIEQYGEQKSKREQYRIDEVEGVKELLDFPPYKAVQILTPEASAKLCRGTQWCVKDPKFFKQYSDNLIMVLKDGEPYYLLHEESGQYKDKYDEGLLREDDAPEALDVLKVLYNSNIVKEPAGNDFGVCMFGSLSQDQIINSARLSYAYAEGILQGRFELGEPAIATDPYWSYQYSYYILEDRFELGERSIAESAEWSFEYAKDVIGGRFELGEAAIATNAKYSCQYAVDVLEYSRFPLGEPVITTDAGWSYNYARDVIGGRFELGEPAIAKSAEWAYEYTRDVIKDRFELGEPAILNSPYADAYLKLIRKSNNA